MVPVGKIGSSNLVTWPITKCVPLFLYHMHYLFVPYSLYCCPFLFSHLNHFWFHMIFIPLPKISPIVDALRRSLKKNIHFHFLLIQKYDLWIDQRAKLKRISYCDSQELSVKRYHVKMQWAKGRAKLLLMLVIHVHRQ